MNIIEAYIQKYKNLVIIISGLNGSGKTTIAKSISRDFKIDRLKLVDYIKNNEINWNSLNSDINEKSKNGIVISGEHFPADKLLSDITFHIHIKLSKQNIILKREKFNKSHNIPKLSEDELKKINTNELPQYFDNLKNMKIDKYINANQFASSDDYYNKIYTEIFDYIINQITNKMR